MRRTTFRRTLTTAFVLLAALPAATVARTPVRPMIKGAEIGYFGSAVVTHEVAVFVYSNEGPRAGNQVTVCLGGVCEHAHGHSAKLAWYSASFTLRRGLHMGDRVKFTVVASSAAGSSRITARDPLLCMHNDGSTPQR